MKYGPSGEVCCECGIALEYTFGGCDSNTDYTCEECEAHTCLLCLPVHEKKHEVS